MAEYEARKVILKDQLGRYVVPWTGAAEKVNGVAPDSTGNVVVDANPPAISVAATTLEAGSQATVTKTGTDKEPVFTFGIPKGDKGDKGEKGDTGPQGPKGDTGATGPQGPAGSSLGQIGAATLHSSDVMATSGSGNIVNYYPAVQRDAYGRVIKVGRAGYHSNCNCNCDCGTD